MNDVSKNLDKFINELLPKAISNGLEVAGQYVENKAKENITEYKAVQTSTLKNSITHVVDKEAQEVVIGTPVEYGPAIHQGHGSLKGRPFLKDVADQNMAEIVEAFSRGASL
ncbi:MAG: HK97 gp10 family phage protein [Cellulosilyticaceae bacterium]